MWPFRKKKEELEEIEIPFKEPRKELIQDHEDEELILSKLDLIIAKLENLEQRIKNLER